MKLTSMLVVKLKIKECVNYQIWTSLLMRHHTARPNVARKSPGYIWASALMRHHPAVTNMGNCLIWMGLSPWTFVSNIDLALTQHSKDNVSPNALNNCSPPSHPTGGCCNPEQPRPCTLPEYRQIHSSLWERLRACQTRPLSGQSCRQKKGPKRWATPSGECRYSSSLPPGCGNILRACGPLDGRWWFGQAHPNGHNNLKWRSRLFRRWALSWKDGGYHTRGFEIPDWPTFQEEKCLQDSSERDRLLPLELAIPQDQYKTDTPCGSPNFHQNPSELDGDHLSDFAFEAEAVPNKNVVFAKSKGGYGLIRCRRAMKHLGERCLLVYEPNTLWHGGQKAMNRENESRGENRLVWAPSLIRRAILEKVNWTPNRKS